jgi:hypothetical protein
MALQHVRGPDLQAWRALPAPFAATRSKRAAERERTDGHGHGMSRNRTPKTEEGLPHDGDRREKQPYAREVEEYSGEGVAHPPPERPEGGNDPARRRRR